jgi:hypothetical protein
VNGICSKTDFVGAAISDMPNIGSRIRPLSHTLCPDYCDKFRPILLSETMLRFHDKSYHLKIQITKVNTAISCLNEKNNLHSDSLSYVFRN